MTATPDKKVEPAATDHEKLVEEFWKRKLAAPATIIEELKPSKL